MSLHYEFALACFLVPNTPEQVLNTLRYMTRSEEYEFDNPPEHRLFKGDDWRTLLQLPLPEGLYPGNLHSTFRQVYVHAVGGYRYTLGFRTWVHEDGFNESWWLFLPWLAHTAKRSAMWDTSASCTLCNQP